MSSKRKRQSHVIANVQTQDPQARSHTWCACFRQCGALQHQFITSQARLSCKVLVKPCREATPATCNLQVGQVRCATAHACELNVQMPPRISPHRTIPPAGSPVCWRGQPACKGWSGLGQRVREQACAWSYTWRVMCTKLRPKALAWQPTGRCWMRSGRQCASVRMPPWAGHWPSRLCPATLRQGSPWLLAICSHMLAHSTQQPTHHLPADAAGAASAAGHHAGLQQP